MCDSYAGKLACEISVEPYYWITPEGKVVDAIALKVETPSEPATRVVMTKGRAAKLVIELATVLKRMETAAKRKA